MNYFNQIRITMKILILNGSPRALGNTATLTRILSDRLQKDSNTVKTVSLYDLKIEPCNDCRYCKNEYRRCIINDDMDDLYREMESSDRLIFATPVYWYGPTAKTKLMIDRLRPYFGSGLLRGKSGAVCVIAGDGYRDSGLTISMFRRIFKTLGINEAIAVAFRAYNEGDILFNKMLERKVKALIERLTSINEQNKP